MNKKTAKTIALSIAALSCLSLGTVIFAETIQGSGVAGLATHIKGNLGAVAQLITAIAYVAGMGFGVAAILKFKAHKDNPTQVGIGIPIAFLFIAGALLFLPSVFRSAATTLYASGVAAGTSGVSTF